MKKLALILTLCFFCFANFALAADNETEQTAKEPAAAAEQKEETKDKNANDDIKILIDKEAMNSELQQDTNNKCYLELEENKYIVYVIDTKDDDTRRDLFKKAPAERVNHLYTNNEEIYNYLAKNQDANTTVTVLPAALKKMKLPLTAQLFINSGS